MSVVNCDICGKLLYKCESKKRDHNFCGRKCQGTWMKTAFSHRISRNCCVCGKKITRSPSRIRGKFLLCDKKCRAIYTQGNHWGLRTGKHKVNGYIRVLVPDHPFRDNKGYVFEHRLIAEKALKKILPRTTVVHHINGDPSDNRNSNLVVCQDDRYHRILHNRQKEI